MALGKEGFSTICGLEFKSALQVALDTKEHEAIQKYQNSWKCIGRALVFMGAAVTGYGLTVEALWPLFAAAAIRQFQKGERLSRESEELIIERIEAVKQLSAEMRKDWLLNHLALDPHPGIKSIGAN